MKIGSLFSGYGGLDLAVSKVLNAEVVWHCEWESAPSKVLEANFPGVPLLVSLGLLFLAIQSQT